MKIKTFGPQELSVVKIILKKESNQTAIAAFLHSVGKYLWILVNGSRNSMANNFELLSAIISPHQIDFSLNLEIRNVGFPFFCLIEQNPNPKN